MTREAYEIKREGEIQHNRPFARALLRDPRLSFSAKGLFAYLWDLPVGWTIKITHLIRVGPQGRDAIRSILSELEAVGGLRVEVRRTEKGHIVGKEWILVSPHLWAVEIPLSTTEEPAPPEVGGVWVGKSDPKNRPTINIEKKSKAIHPVTVKTAPSKACGAGGRKIQPENPTRKSTPRKKHSSSFSSSTTPTQLDFAVRHGVFTYNTKDVAKADALLDEFGPEALRDAIDALERKQIDPLPSRVLRQAYTAQQAATRKIRDEAARPQPTPFSIDPAAQARGASLLTGCLQAKIGQVAGEGAP